MRLLRTSFVGVCQHKSLNCSWSPGLNGIIGPNGAGKSNLLRMLELAITGHSVNAGKKADNICQFISKDDDSLIVIEGEHKGVRFSLCRDLRGKKTKLILPHEEVIGDSAVTQALLSFLGVSKQMLSQFVFVRQGALAEFINSTPSARKESFQRLFGLQRFHQIWSALNHVKSQDFSELQNAIISLQRQIEETRAQLEKAITERDKLSPIVMPEDEFNQNIELLSAVKSLEGLKKEKESLEDKIASLDSDVLAADKIFREKKAEYDKLLAQCESRLLDDDRARKIIEQIPIQKRRRELVKAANELTTHVKQIESKLTDFPEDLINRADELDKKLSEIAERRSSLKETWNVLINGGKVECPVCFTLVDNIKDRLLKMRKELVESRYDVQAWREELHTIKKLLAKQNKLESALSEINKELSIVNAQLDSLPDISEIDESEVEKAKKQLEESKKMAAALNMLQAEVDTCRREVVKTRAKRDSLHERLVKLTNKMEECEDLTEEDIAYLEEEIKRQRPLRAEFADLNARCEEQEKTLAMLISQMDARLKELEGAKKEKKWAEYADKIRKVVHKGAAPATLMQSYLHHITDKTNDMLDKLYANYRVFLDPEDFSFVAYFPDGRKQRDNRLSGGQQVLLSIAFRIAVNTTFTDGLGLLCLDEPTTFLDEEHKERLSEALIRLRRISHAHQLQCLVVTHDKQLFPAFDQVVTLSPPEEMESSDGERDSASRPVC